MAYVYKKSSALSTKIEVWAKNMGYLVIYDQMPAPNRSHFLPIGRPMGRKIDPHSYPNTHRNLSFEPHSYLYTVPKVGFLEVIQHVSKKSLYVSWVRKHIRCHLMFVFCASALFGTNKTNERFLLCWYNEL